MTAARRAELLARVDRVNGHIIGVLLPLPDPPKDKWGEGHVRAFTFVSGAAGELARIAREALQP